MFICEKLFH